MIGPCDWCLTLSGRIHAARECCRLRSLAVAPAHNRNAVFAQVKKDEGSAALEELKAKVRIEYVRQRDMRRAAQRALEQAALAVGKAATAELLGKMKTASRQAAVSETLEMEFA